MSLTAQLIAVMRPGIAYTDEQIAAMLRETMDRTRLVLSLFVANGVVERLPDGRYRRKR